MLLPRYLLGIRPRERVGRWQEWTRERLRERALARDSMLGGDGELLDVAGAPMGSQRFVERAEVEGAPWATHRSPCPWVGETLGYLGWEWWHGYLSLEDRRFLFEELRSATCGFFVRTDSGELFEPIVEAEHELVNVSQKHGFSGGACFLHRPGQDAAYEAYVRTTLARALERHELRGPFITYGTSHNPYRIEDFEPRRGESPAACQERFRAHAHWTVRLWGYDLATLSSQRLRDFLDDDHLGS